MRHFSTLSALLLLALLLSFNRSPVQAASAAAVRGSLLPKTRATAQGSSSGQTSALAFRDQSGTQNTPMT